MRQHSIMGIRRVWLFIGVMAALALGALACGNVPERPDSAATVQAFYATITQQAASGSPFPTRAITQTPAQATTAPTERPAATPTASPTPPEARSGNGVLITIPRCPSGVGMQVNAARDDWENWPQNASPVTVALNTVTFGANEVIDNDLSGQALLCWNDDALYMYIEVYDDVYVQTQSGRLSWQGDGIEFMFDGDLRGDFYEEDYSADDTHLALNPGNFLDNSPHVFQYRPSETVLDDSEVQFSVNRPPQAGATYYVEAAIFWDTLRVDPKADTNYGMCIAISDNDHVDTAQQDSMASHCTELETPHPTTFATVRLAG